MYRKLKNVNKIDNVFITFEIAMFKLGISCLLKSCWEHLIYPLVDDIIVLRIGQPSEISGIILTQKSIKTPFRKWSSGKHKFI